MTFLAALEMKRATAETESPLSGDARTIRTAGPRILFYFFFFPVDTVEEIT